MRKISILGSTGSIGTQTLDVVRNNNDIVVLGMTAGKNIHLLEKQIREFHPRIVSVSTQELAKELEVLVHDTNTKIVYGNKGITEVAVIEEVDTVVTAVVGMMGIIPTIEAIKAKKNIALANKETLVTAGHIIMKLAKEKGVCIYPVDSEHSAIFQALNGEFKKEVSKILLTASGGPFRGRTREQMRNVTVEDALKHPNWSMGKKITIDSATMVNKGLEVMEAQWLFDVPADKIQVIVQPQSVIHSMVEFVDGGVMAQLGSPDMRLPIQYALYFPHRKSLNTKRLDFFEIQELTFERPDMNSFRGLKMAYEASQRGGNIPTVFNAANEIAVSYFLSKKINFLNITEMIEEAMNEITFIANPTIEDILSTESSVYEFIKGRW